MGASNLYKTVSDTKLLLQDNWTVNNIPQVSFAWDERTTGFMDDRKDVLILTPANENAQYFGMHGDDFLHSVFVSIDIHTFKGLEYHENVVNEVFRILKANIRRTGFVDLLITSSSSSNDMFRNIFRHNVIVQYRKLNP